MINFIKQKYINLVSDTRFSEILTGSVWALSARVLAAVFGFVCSIIVARYYGAEMVGIVAVTNSFLILATVFTVLGTNTSILRLIPEHLARYSPTSAFRVYRKTQYMVIGVSLVTGIMFFFSANLIADKVFSKPHLSFYFALASVFIIFKSLMLLNTQAVRGLRLIRVFALMLVLPQSFNIIILAVVGYLWPVRDIPVYAVLFGFAMTGIIGWIIMERAFKKRMRLDDFVHTIPRRTILSISLPMFMTATMMFLIAETGVIMLGMFRSEAEVGYYAIAVKFATITAFVLHAVNTMAGPKFSELFHLNKLDELFHVAKKSSKLIFFTTLPLLVGLLVLGKPILSIVFGREFSIAYPALVLLVLGQFVNVISGSSGIFMNMTGNQIVFRNIMIIAAGLNIGLNFLLTPHLGMNGTAIAAMASFWFSNISTLAYMKLKFGRTTGYFPFWQLLVRKK
jgi:O-antigen/teichoic acid export membrane protein